MAEPLNDGIQLEELICFALHSASSAMNRSYQPHLAKLGLTYPQYICLMALWDQDDVTVGALCSRLKTQTSTLTPLLKRLEISGHIRRERSLEDERRVHVHLTGSGRALRSASPDITRCIVSDTGLSLEKLNELVGMIGQLRNNLEKTAENPGS